MVLLVRTFPRVLHHQKCIPNSDENISPSQERDEFPPFDDDGEKVGDDDFCFCLLPFDAADEMRFISERGFCNPSRDRESSIFPDIPIS